MDKKWWHDALVNPEAFKKPSAGVSISPISPLYVRFRDLNADESGRDLTDARPKPAVEVGLKFEF